MAQITLFWKLCIGLYYYELCLWVDQAAACQELLYICWTLIYWHWKALAREDEQLSTCMALLLSKVLETLLQVDR